MYEWEMSVVFENKYSLFLRPSFQSPSILMVEFNFDQSYVVCSWDDLMRSQLFDRLPSRHSAIWKIMRINVAALVLIFSCIAASLLIFYFTNQRQSIEHTLDAQVALVRYNLAAAVLNHDPQQLHQVLALLQKMDRINNVLLFDAENHFVAEYTVKKQQALNSAYVVANTLAWPANHPTTQPIIQGPWMYLLRPLQDGHQSMGHHLLFQVRVMPNGITSDLLMGGLLLVGLIIGLIAAMMTSKIMKIMQAPMNAMTLAIQRVCETENYAMRLDQPQQDASLHQFTQLLNQLFVRLQSMRMQSKQDQEALEVQLNAAQAELKYTRYELDSAVLSLKKSHRLLEESAENNRLSEERFLEKRKVFANISHELRTPLTGVLGMLSMLKNTHLSEDQTHYVDIAHTSGITLLDLINDILDFSKIKEGKLTLENIEFDLHESMEEVLNLLGESSYQKEVELVSYEKNKIPKIVKGDPIRFKQVIYNLVGNAVKFTAKGCVKLVAECVNETAQQFELRFEVIDTGVGIKRDVLGSIFDSFSQADISTTRHYGGTGLGLALCQQLTQMMGGAIGAESEYGKGSTFWFTLKFDRSDQLPECIMPIPAIKKVLIIDDQTVSLLALGQRLERLGIEHENLLSPAHLSERLMQASHDHDLSAIIIDIHIPNLDIRLVTELVARHSSKAQPVSIIWMGAMSQRHGLVEQDNIPYLAKPFRMKKLIALLSAVAGNNEQMQVTHFANENQQNATAQASHVLVVEDNYVNQLVVMNRLKMLGCEVDIAEDGRQALDFLREKKFDLVFMDCQMPVLDGYHATAQFREMERQQGLALNARTPIIAMTAESMAEDRQQCADVGMDDYMPKPIRDAEWDRVVEDWHHCLKPNYQQEYFTRQ